MVKVWRLVDLIDIRLGEPQQCEPVHTLSEHALPVTDLYCGMGVAEQARLATCSLDRSCKLWELGTGLVVASFVFPSFINTTVMDREESRLFAGAGDGNIYSVDVRTRAHMARGGDGAVGGVQTHGTADDAAEENVYRTHDGAIVCLATSQTGTRLVSGGKDGRVVVWDVASRQVLKIFNRHKGTITNVLVVPRPPDLFGGGGGRQLPVMAALQRTSQSHVVCLQGDPYPTRLLHTYDQVGKNCSTTEPADEADCLGESDDVTKARKRRRLMLATSA